MATSALNDANTDGHRQLENLNIESHRLLTTPEQLKARLPVTEEVREYVQEAREAVRAILERRDHRLLVVIGPCSIHDVDAAREYARRLKSLSEQPGGKPILANDPHLDDTFHIDEGLTLARQLLLDVASLGLPLATEALDPITPQYLQDLIAWSAIGARTTESQTHRELASGLSSAVGFKNGTDGSLDVAVNALQSVASPHRFLGINPAGQVAVLHTRGNPYAHIVLRGGTQGPNYDAAGIANCEQALQSIQPDPNIMVDCSHANSDKDHTRQPLVAKEICRQIVAGNRSVIGLMIESHLQDGNQKLTRGGEGLDYGVSITDACIDWDTTVTLLQDLADKLSDSLLQRLTIKKAAASS